MCLEDKFELLKEIGDGSFGSVALARVRTAGAHIARRGTMVSILHSIAITKTYLFLGRNQDNEEEFRLVWAMFRASRGHLPALITDPCPSSPGS